MNSTEYWKSPKGNNEFYKKAHNLLLKWKNENNITARCIIHHRDDNEAVRAYNEAHYELWGFNEDGTFEYGKYVVFMTSSEHAKYHNEGLKNPMRGKHHTDEARRKMSDSGKTKTFTEIHRQHLSESCSGERNGFYGKHHSTETREKLSINNARAMQGKSHGDDTKKAMADKRRVYWSRLKEEYQLYKLQNPQSEITISQFRQLHLTNEENGLCQQ